jgi:hypothetical protein
MAQKNTITPSEFILFVRYITTDSSQQIPEDVVKYILSFGLNKLRLIPRYFEYNKYLFENEIVTCEGYLTHEKISDYIKTSTYHHIYLSYINGKEILRRNIIVHCPDEINIVFYKNFYCYRAMPGDRLKVADPLTIISDLDDEHSRDNDTDYNIITCNLSTLKKDILITKFTREVASGYCDNVTRDYLFENISKQGLIIQDFLTCKCGNYKKCLKSTGCEILDKPKYQLFTCECEL